MQQIGSYKITKKIKAGGMAVVYQGIQESLSRPVAIKVLKQQFSDNSNIMNYFNRESLIIARLIHPNIIHVIDRGLTDQGMPYFVMNFIKGIDTGQLIIKGGLEFNKRLDIIIQTCKALAYAHKNGVIHRDIKPENILIDTEGNAVVTDFGIAQFYQRGKETQKENVVLGTPSYMSPEQKKGNEVTFACDIYSLGVVMYELFTGTRLPKKIIQRPSSIVPEIPASLERIILQCLSADPEKRPASVETIKNQLLVLFQGAHINTVQRKKALSSVPKMDDIFTILDIIKENDISSVYLIRHNISGQLLVAKTFNAMTNGIKIARVFISLKHDNIINIQGVSGSDSNSIIVMDYLSGGSLADRMVMPHMWQEALKIIHGVCKGLFFAHNNRIAHGNLKPANILFTNSEKVKLSDFGLEGDFSSKNQRQQESWPERIQSDIFEAGKIFYKIIIGCDPDLKGDSFVHHKEFKALPHDIKRLIIRFLTQKTSIRFQSMKQAVGSIEESAVILNEDLSDSSQKSLASNLKTNDPTEGVTEDELVDAFDDTPDLPVSKRRFRSLLFIVFKFILFLIAVAALLFLTPD